VFDGSHGELIIPSIIGWKKARKRYKVSLFWNTENRMLSGSFAVPRSGASMMNGMAHLPVKSDMNWAIGLHITVHSTVLKDVSNTYLSLTFFKIPP
jgi:hypothetical protein